MTINRDLLSGVNELNVQHAELIEYPDVAFDVASAQKPYVDILQFLGSSDNLKPELFTDDIRLTIKTECDNVGNEAGLMALAVERSRLKQLKDKGRAKYRTLGVFDGSIEQDMMPPETDLDAWGMIFVMQDAARVHMDAIRNLKTTGGLKEEVLDTLARAALRAANQASLEYLAQRGRRLTQLTTMFKSSPKARSRLNTSTTPQSLAGEPDFEDPRTNMDLITGTKFDETLIALFGN